jgi:hypothetical protein
MITDSKTVMAGRKVSARTYSRAGIGQGARIRSGALVHSLRSKDFCFSGLVWHRDTKLWSLDTVVTLTVHCGTLRYRPVCDPRPPQEHLKPASL